MGKFVSDQPRPHLRMKSVDRLVEEIRIQSRDFSRRHFGWVDPCFNAHPRTPAAVSETLLRKNIKVSQSAWVRADCIVRDARSGALATLVQGGLNEVYVGVERPDDQGLRNVHKSSSIPVIRDAFRILTRDHPRVFTLGTFIYGLPGDTPSSVRAIYQLSLELEMDKAFFIPLTPLPGTPFWRDDLWDATGEHFRDFGFLPSGAGACSRRGLEWALLSAIAFNWAPARWRGYWRSLTAGDARKRRVSLHLASRSALFAVRGMLGSLVTGRRTGMVYPSWYEN
jgi:hypothetical protein